MMFDINRAGRGGAALEFGLVPPAPERVSGGPPSVLSGSSLTLPY